MMVEKAMTAQDFLQLPQTTQPTQLINGDVIVSPSPIAEHQRIVFRTGKVIDALIPDGEVLISPMDVYLDEVNVYQPDVFWISTGGPCQERDGVFYGPPDLVVEVLSPSTARYDRSVKFLIYEKSGVREYWIIDPESRFLEIWSLREGEFARQGVYGAGTTCNSPILSGIDTSKIFEDA